ncbi:SPW repeat protein [Bordetella sp. FB-8]|uniref:SPW repeat protein n=1 Tax=Bordetella sp. FB-8 TaxID=1159870 RepID=UPI000374009B|nr:SPW repeat protein [Bordetella sp. FB-8]
MKHRWQDWAMTIVGLYVIVSPWVIPYFWPDSSISSLAQWNQVIVGAAVVIVAIAWLASAQIWEEYAMGIVGLWLLMSPWLLGFSREAAFALSAVIAGLIIIALAAGALLFVRYHDEYEA